MLRVRARVRASAILVSKARKQSKTKSQREEKKDEVVFVKDVKEEFLVLWFWTIEKEVIDFVRIKSNQHRSSSEETALTFLTFVVVHWWDNGSHQIPPNWRQICLFHFYGFLLGRKLAAPCIKSMMPLSILKWHQIDGWMRENSTRAEAEPTALTPPPFKSQTQICRVILSRFSRWQTSSRKAWISSFVRSCFKARKRSKKCSTTTMAAPFRKGEVFMAFWDLNPLDILRQSPSITQLDHEPGNTTTKSSNFWEPPKKE